MSIDSYKRPYQVRADYRRRDQIVLSDTDKLRIDYGRNSITLKRQNTFGDYPTDNDLYVELPAALPIASGWGLFEAVADVPLGTSLGYQVKNDEGGSWLYWNGSAWTSAGATDWNTEEEISDNLVTLVASSYLQFKVNLKTTDLKATPEVYGINFTYLTRVDPYEDFLYRVLLPFFKGIDLYMSLKRKMDGADNFIDLGNLDDLGYQIEDVIAAYNITTDPNRITDIATGYNPTTRRISLSTTPSADDIVEVRMKYNADSISSVGVDYKELPRVPTYIVEDATIERTYHFLDESVSNKAEKVAEVFEFEQSDWTVSVVVAAGRQVDLARMVSAVKVKLGERAQLYSYNFDVYYDAIWTGEPDFSMSREISDLREARISLEVQKVLLPLTDGDKPLVTNFEPTLQRRVSYG